VAPWSNRKWQRAGWVIVALVVFCRIATATEVPLVLLPALGIGIAAGSLALLALGAPPRRPRAAAVEAAIRRGGLDAGDVSPDGVMARNSQPFTATTASGLPLFVKVVGRDERDAAVLARVWRAIRVKGIEDERAPGSPHHSLERQALVAMMAAAAGVRAPRPLLVDTIDESSALAVFEAVDASRLADVDPRAVTDRMLRDVWTQAASLQNRRLAHRWLNSGNVLIDADGRAWIVGYSYADQAGDPATLTVDTAELLTSLALLVGPERAVKSAVSVLGRERVAASLPLLQPLALTSETRKALGRDKQFIKTLQREVQAATRTPEFKPAQIERIGWRTVFMVIATAAVVYILLVQFTNAGDIAGALANMNLWYLVPILLFTFFTFVAAALSLIGAVTRAIPLILTTVVQFAQTFLNRFTPYNAGGMTLRVRYLQKRGTDLTSGAAAVGLTSAASGVMQVVLFVLFYLAAGAQTQDTRIELPDTSTIAALVLLILLAAGLLLLIPWVRRRVLPPVFNIMRKAFSTIGELSRNPAKMALLFGGAALSKLAYIAAFFATCRAFGVNLPFATVGAVYLTATTIGSAVPTPGGLGGVEAALVGCLTAVGVDSDDAVAIMLVFRLATFWLPVLPGYLCFWSLERKEVV
jgi:undecaprenyl-diphosphatase